jgi:cold shock CspA family protein
VFGQIYTWSLLGWGYILAANGKDLYFLHYSNIKQGADLVAAKQHVRFDVNPPLPGKKHPRAINVIVGVHEVGGVE